MELNSSACPRICRPRTCIVPKNLEEVDVGLLQFEEQIEEGHTFVPVVLADTIRVLCIPKMTLSTHF